MKTSRIAIILVLLMCGIGSYVRAEPLPGFRFPAQIIRQSKDEERDKEHIIFRFKSDDVNKTLAISFDSKTRKITGAIWMTKGGSPLKLPSMGLVIPEKPTPDAKPVVVLSHEKLKGVEYSDITFVNFIWEKPRNQKANKTVNPTADRL